MVNPDAIRLALFGQPFSAEAEPMVWTIARYMVESLFKAGHPIVILDATNLLEFRRREWLCDEWTVKLKVFKTDAEICKHRAAKTGQVYLLPVIDKMMETVEWPSDSAWSFISDDVPEPVL